MLQDGARPSRLRWNSLHFAPTVAAVSGFIDSAAGGHDYVIRIARIDIDRENIGVVDDAILDASPGLSAIRRLVRQVTCSGIDRVGVLAGRLPQILRAPGRRILSRQLLPVFAGVV